MQYPICQRPYSHLLFIFQKRMHQIMTTCFHSVRQKLHRRTGTFDLLGFDFLIDEDFKVSLPLYMTFVSNPAFTINLGDHNSRKNWRRRFSSKSLLGNMTYSCDVKRRWRVSVGRPRFQAFSFLCLKGAENLSSRLAVWMRVIYLFLDWTLDATSNCHEFQDFLLFSCQVWLLEVNINPALHTNCQVLMDLLPGVVDETLSK